MKKLFNILIAAFMLVAVASCNNAKDDLAGAAKEANTECPMDLGLLGTLNSIEYDEDENVVVYNVTINENIYSHDGYDADTIKRGMLNGLDASGDPATAEFIKVLKEARANIKYAMHFPKAGITESITLTYSQI